MKDLLRKMEALVKDDCRLQVPGCCNMNMYSCVSVNGNIDAHFIVGDKEKALYLYDVIFSENLMSFV